MLSSLQVFFLPITVFFLLFNKASSILAIEFSFKQGLTLILTIIFFHAIGCYQTPGLWLALMIFLQFKEMFWHKQTALKPFKAHNPLQTLEPHPAKHLPLSPASTMTSRNNKLNSALEELKHLSFKRQELLERKKVQCIFEELRDRAEFKQAGEAATREFCHIYVADAWEILTSINIGTSVVGKFFVF